MTTTTAVTLGGGSAINVELENVARFAIDEHTTIERTKLYEAKVGVKPWSNFKELQEFKHAGDDHASPSSTTSDLVVNKVVQLLPGTGRSSYAKKRRAKRMGSHYYSFARWKTKDLGGGRLRENRIGSHSEERRGGREIEGGVLVPAMGRDPNRSFLQHGPANMFFPLLNLVNEIEEMDRANAFDNHETKVNELNRNGKSNKIIVTLRNRKFLVA
ncbi:hypothetical protein PVK06_021590 [Gossypium arboreum]|uniref:Cysteine proteinase inhibitor n=1 Tax=Gossypium arboreum TaxID=29729 RepID=A0ABR0PQP4_GOSAR|nr:hypothetical protein PVK06_021590 [Gossypium arboreum]